MTDGFKAYVDWDKDDSYTDESALLQRALIRRGRESSLSGDGYQYCDTGSLDLTFNNASKRYTYFYASSPIYDYLLPNRPVYLMVTYGGTDYQLFTGKTKNIRLYPQDNRAIISCSDGSEYLHNRKTDLANTVSINRYADDAIGDILTAAEWPAGARSIVDNGDVIPLFWIQANRTAWDQLTDVCKAFGAEIFVAADGKFTYIPRTHSNTGTFSLDDDDVLASGTEPQQPWSEIRNDINVIVKPRTTTSADVEVWRLNEVIELAATEARTFWLDYAYDGEEAPMSSITTPAATTDYTANAQADGLGTNMTSDLDIALTTYVTRAKIILTNNNVTDPMYVTLCKLRGTLYIAPNEITISESDATSIAAYEKASLTVSTPFLQEQAIGQDRADDILLLYKSARNAVTVKLLNKPTLQFDADLFDKVTIDLAGMGATGDYRITYIEHDLSPRRWLTTWRMEPTPASITGYWIFTAKLGTTTKFAG